MSAEHFPGCPCGACQGIRAAQPVAAAMQARHLSGASIGKLVEWEVGKSPSTGERQWSPIATLAVVSHGHDETNLTFQWDDYGLEETTLHPDEWVRVTAPAERMEAIEAATIESVATPVWGVRYKGRVYEHLTHEEALTQLGHAQADVPAELVTMGADGEWTAVEA